MKYIIILLLCSSCAYRSIRPRIRPKPKKAVIIKDKYVPKTIRIVKCIKDFIKMDVKPLNASTICSQIYQT